MSGTNGKKLVLVVLDGWGVGPKDGSNPLYAAKLPNLSEIKADFPYLNLQSSGMIVGLPWAEEGNSEIGHLTIGAGRIVYQNVAQIDLSINNGSFFENKILKKTLLKTKKSGSFACFAGLLGTGITHSSFNHLKALMRMADDMEVKYKLHLFLDGRDSPPRECLDLIKALPEEKIGSLSGRFYAMDRDDRMERTKEAFLSMVGEKTDSPLRPSEYVSENYKNGITDEFIRPASFNGKDLSIKESDSIIFFNFRKDRMRQISRVFRERFPETEIVSFAEYEAENGIPGIFTFNKIMNSLPQVFAERGLSQLRVAESEKQAHVTYFFNAEREEPFPREFRIIIPSKKIANYDRCPEMMAEEITTRVVTAIEEESYDFILVNYANPDMVAHTGNFDATVKAAEIVDSKIGIITDVCLKTGTALVITSDHGNAEKLTDSRTGEKDTKHNSNPVPFMAVDQRFFRKRTDEEISGNEKTTVGSLCDIAPTILELMDIPKPEEMTGQSLVQYLP